MITPEQFYEHVVLWIRNRWGTTRLWDDERAAAVALDFQFMDLSTVERTLTRLYTEEGLQTAPSPSKVMAAVVSAHKAEGLPIGPTETSTDPCETYGHSWAIIDSDDAKGTRSLCCVRCHAEKEVPWRAALTPGEIDSGVTMHRSVTDPTTTRKDLL
jgi:hypothetical protein